MATDIVMPQMGESIVEGTITKWLKKPGDRVQRVQLLRQPRRRRRKPPRFPLSIKLRLPLQLRRKTSMRGRRRWSARLLASIV